MKRKFTLAALVLVAAAAHAQVTISDAWVRGTVPAQKASGAFMKISASENVLLVAGETPVAGKVEIHEMTNENNVMKMRHLKDGLPIAQGVTVELKPGSYHVILMQLNHTLEGAQTVPLKLTFFKGATGEHFTKAVQAPVKALSANNKMGGDITTIMTTTKVLTIMARKTPLTITTINNVSWTGCASVVKVVTMPFRMT